MLVRPQQYPHVAFDVSSICPRRHISWDVQLTIKMIVPLDPWKTSHPTIGPLYGQLGLCGFDHANLSIPFLLSINPYVMDQILVVMKGSLANSGQIVKGKWSSKTTIFQGRNCEFQGGYVCCTQVTKPTSWKIISINIPSLTWTRTMKHQMKEFKPNHWKFHPQDGQSASYKEGERTPLALGFFTPVTHLFSAISRGYRTRATLHKEWKRSAFLTEALRKKNIVFFAEGFHPWRLTWNIIMERNPSEHGWFGRSPPNHPFKSLQITLKNKPYTSTYKSSGFVSDHFPFGWFVVWRFQPLIFQGVSRPCRSKMVGWSILSLVGSVGSRTIVMSSLSRQKTSRLTTQNCQKKTLA